MTCDQKHTRYQPTEAEFKCPKCGAKSGHFCVDDGPNLECDLLHDDDDLVCFGKDHNNACPARYRASGKAFAAMLVKQNSLVKCEHCKGTGFVKAPKEDK